MSRHRRGDLPFGRTRVPNITFRFFTMLHAVEEVDEENEYGEKDQEASDGQDQVRAVKPKRRIIIHDAAAHTEQTNAHHAKGQDKERGCHDPEVHLAPELVHAATGRFREPVIQRRKEREDESAEDRIVEVTYDEVSISQMQVCRNS